MHEFRGIEHDIPTSDDRNSFYLPSTRVSFCGVIDAENLCTIAKLENDAKLMHNGHGATHKLRPKLASKIVELFSVVCSAEAGRPYTGETSFDT